MSGDYVFALVAVATLASLLVVWEQSVTAYAGLYALQSLCVGALAINSGLAHGAILAVIIAVLALAAKGVVLPLGLRRFGGRLASGGRADLLLHTPSSLLVAFALVVLGFMMLNGITTDAGGGSGLALGQAFIGLWLVASRRSVLSQTAGLMVAENGASLLLILIAGSQSTLIEALLLVEAVAVPVALLLLARLVRYAHDSADTARLQSITEAGSEEAAS